MITVHLLMYFQKFPSGTEEQSRYLEHTRETAGAKIGPFKSFSRQWALTFQLLSVSVVLPGADIQHWDSRLFLDSICTNSASVLSASSQYLHLRLEPTTAQPPRSVGCCLLTCRPLAEVHLQ